MFDHRRAADIITEIATEFLSSAESEGLGLVFVDLSEMSEMMRVVRRKVEEVGLDPLRFLTVEGDITTLKSVNGLECCCIANPADW